ncbi:MAG TPA: zf-HC2 domain-containing protein [Chloroflexia bacterium]|nr:zf-HC2 domain-containing protein [Chloroflexia bacterium]
MNCSNIRPLLSAYYDGDVSTEERNQVESHLASCHDCRHVLAEFRAIGSDIRSLPMPQPPVGLRRDVWRAIEAQQANARVFRGSPARGVITTLPQPKEKSFLPNILKGIGRSWAAALPAALLLGGLLLVLSVILLRNNPVDVASLERDVVTFSQPVHVRLSKEVIWDPDCLVNTNVRRIEGSQPVTLTKGVDIALEFNQAAREITIQPIKQWEPGARYDVYIDAPKIGLIAGSGKLDDKSHTLSFSVAENTPTPTSTPTITPTPTDTPIPPPNTPGPTTVAENTPLPTQEVIVPTSGPTQQPPVPPSATTAPKASPTVRVNPTRTANVPPTQTVAPEPTRPIPQSLTPTPLVPTATPTVHETQPVPTSTAIPPKGTPTATPTVRGGPTATATPVNSEPCDLVPVQGFGKVWGTTRALRAKIGCPEAAEMGIPDAAVQHFQGGTMVWRGDMKLIYVFINGANGQSGTWLQFQDTWQDTDTPPKAVNTPPPGLIEPVRGFGKLWNSNGYVHQSLGWGVDTEVKVTGAWQKFEHGEAIWTSDRDIYFMFSDGTFQRYEDTFVAPGEE